MTMNKTEAEMIENMSKVVADAIISSQNGNVTNKIENPILWITFCGFILGIVAILTLYIYTNNQDTQNKDIQNNRATIEDINDNIEDMTTTVKQIQNNQVSQTSATQSLLAEIKELRENDNKILSTRFEDKDFPVHIQPYINRLEAVEVELKNRKDTIKYIEVVKEDIINIKARLTILEAR